MISFQHSVQTTASPEKVFRIYENVKGWKDWDKGLKDSRLEGALEAGVRGTVVPAGGPAIQLEIIEVIKDQSFSDVSRLPLCLLRFDHSLKRAGPSTEITHKVTFTGPLSFLFGRIIGNKMRKSLPETMAGLKKRAEQP
ncbi:MAG: SRPBCC family protein [Elusimicrobia bacterium]|nr:SRPBCC family protein [Elusimicrobiota bacterium]